MVGSRDFKKKKKKMRDQDPIDLKNFFLSPSRGVVQQKSLEGPE